MSVDPAGVLSLPMARLRTLVAASAAFQTWVDEETAEAAAAHVFLAAVPFASVADANFALVQMGDTAEFEGMSTGPEFQESGELVLYFHGTISEDDLGTLPDEFFTYCNTLGAILAQMEALVRSGTYLFVRRIGLSEGPYRSAIKKKAVRGDYYWSRWTVAWGLS